MKFAARINSYIREHDDVLSSIVGISKTQDVRYLDMNYKEHFIDASLTDIKSCINDNGMLVNGVAVRFRKEFIAGAFTHPDANKREEAVDLCKQAVDALRELQGNSLVIWLEHDGYDYAFQTDYQQKWEDVVKCFQKVSNYAPDINVSVEVKPFQPRAFAFIPDTATSLLLINDVACDNFGITLDYCHMLMKHENPAHGVSMVGAKNKLYGIHFNDGYGLNDDGLMIGTGSFLQTLEFIYFLKRYKYDGVIYFDTFPMREAPMRETDANVNMFKKLDSLIESIGMDYIDQLIKKEDAVEISDFMLRCLK